MSTIVSHSPLSILETVRDRGFVPNEGPPTGNGLWGIKWSRDLWRHVTLEGQTRDPIRSQRIISKTAGDAIAITADYDYLVVYYYTVSTKKL